MEAEASEYGQALLAYVPLCYRVALQLTHDAQTASDLTFETVRAAWQLQEDGANVAGLKMLLLASLRQRYIAQQQRSLPCAQLEPASVA